MEQLKLKYDDATFLVEWCSILPFTCKIMKMYKVEKSWFKKNKFTLIHKVKVSNSYYTQISEDLKFYKDILDEVHILKSTPFFNSGKTINLNNI